MDITRRRKGTGRVSPSLPAAPSIRLVSSVHGQELRRHFRARQIFSASLVMFAPVQADKIPPQHDLAQSLDASANPILHAGNPRLVWMGG